MSVTNNVSVIGVFKKIGERADSEGKKTLMFKVGVRRNYKNSKTNSYDYDNIPFYVRHNDTLINFITNFVHDGDWISVSATIYTYELANQDGTKTYRLDLLANELATIGSRKVGTDTANPVGNTSTTPTEEPDFGEVSVSDTDLPW